MICRKNVCNRINTDMLRADSDTASADSETLSAGSDTLSVYSDPDTLDVQHASRNS